MRGIVTLAAALALPADFPQRDFILFTAFFVVLGTLVVQGLTLRPLLRRLDMPHDTMIEDEVTLARAKALKAALALLATETGPSAHRLRQEYEALLADVKTGAEPRDMADNKLRKTIVRHARAALDELRDTGRIGDDAYRRVEQEMDWLELSAQA